VAAQGGIYRVRYKAAKSNSKSESIEAHLWQLAQKGALTMDELKSHPAVGLRVASRANIDGIEDYAATQLHSPDPVVQLAAAEALAECGTQKSAPSIAETLATIGTNSITRHALIHALHRVADDDFLKQTLQDRQPQLRRAALIILDQRPRNSLSSDSAVRALNDANSEVRAAAVAAFRKHTDWMPLAIDHAKRVISRDPVDTSILEVLVNEPEVRRAIRESVTESNRAVDSRIALLDLVAKFPSNDKKAWRNVTDIVLSSGDAKLIAAALRLQTASEEALGQVANNDSLSKSIRLEALRQIQSTNRFEDARHFELFLASLDPTNLPAVRLAAAGLLNSNLTPTQRQDAVAIIRADPLNRPLVDAGSKFSGDQQKLLADFEPLLTGGDENRGQQLFIGKAGCTACHRVGKTGGLVGPDLTRVGAIRSGRDLIESIALPSATFAQGYEPYRIELTSGEALTGVRVRSSDDSFILRDASGAETRLRPSEIKSTERSAVSIMPEGLLNNLSREEIRDLLAYLQKLK
jgi:putative heme-binding domain-containing protein